MEQIPLNLRGPADVHGVYNKTKVTIDWGWILVKINLKNCINSFFLKKKKKSLSDLYLFLQFYPLQSHLNAMSVGGLQLWWWWYVRWQVPWSMLICANLLIMMNIWLFVMEVFFLKRLYTKKIITMVVTSKLPSPLKELTVVEKIIT